MGPSTLHVYLRCVILIPGHPNALYKKQIYRLVPPLIITEKKKYITRKKDKTPGLLSIHPRSPGAWGALGVWTARRRGQLPADVLPHGRETPLQNPRAAVNKRRGDQGRFFSVAHTEFKGTYYEGFTYISITYRS